MGINIGTMIMQMAIRNNPNLRNNQVVQQAFQMYQNHDISGINQLAENVCQSNGTTFESQMQQIGQQLNRR